MEPTPDTPSRFCKVEIPTYDNYSFSKLLLVSVCVSSHNLFVSAANDSTLCIVYDPTTDFDDLLTQLSLKITSLERISIVTHGLPSETFENQCVLKPFLARETFFTSEDLLAPVSYSPGIRMLKSLVETFGVTHIDFLGCHLLLYPEWKSYFQILQGFSTHPVVGASDNNTGNFKYGGDWVLESTNEDVRNIYFTNLIENYTDVLATYTASYSGDGTTRTYTYTDTGQILAVNNYTGALVLPTTLNGTTLINVSMANQSWQTNRNGLTSLVIPSGYVTIDNGGADPDTFYGAVNLTSVTLPDTLTFIGGGAFAACGKLSLINIPANLISFGRTNSTDGCFSNTKIPSIIIPNSCTLISNAFMQSNSSLTSVTFGTGLQQLSNYTFNQCSSLTSVTFLGNSLTYFGSNVFNGTSLSSLVIPGTLTFCADLTFYNHTNLLNINMNLSCNIPQFFCANCSNLQTLTINGTAKELGDGAISRCYALTSVTLPNSLTLFTGAWNFLNDTSLKTITIPPNMKFGSSWAFEGCSSLNTVYLPLTANSNSGMNGDSNPFVTCTALTNIQLYDTSGNYYKFTGTNAQAISRTNTPCILFNQSLRTLSQKIPLLPTKDLSTNTFNVVLDTTGLTITDGKKYTSDTIKTFLTSNASSLASGNLVLTGSSLPGFSNFSLKNTSNKISVFNSSSTCGTNYKTVFTNDDIVNKAFYILQDTSGDVTTLTTFHGTPVVVTNIGTGFTIQAGNMPAVTYAAGSTYSLDGLRFSLGSIFGEATNVVCFSENAKILCYRDDEEVYVPIKEIRKGELVKTLCNGYVPVDIIGHSEINHTVDSEYKYQLYKLSEANYPELFEDLFLTGCHSILTKTLTETQKEESIRLQGKIFVTDGHYRLMACLDERAELYEKEGHYTIWHLALENDDYYKNYGIYANGLLVESSSKRMMYEYSGMKLV